MKTDQVICRTEFRYDEDAKFVEGHAVVFYNSADAGTEYHMGEWFTERIDPRAVSSSLKRKDDVRALYNHDPDALLARVSSGTLTLSKDDRGLKYRFTIDPTDPDHQRVVAKIKRGDLNGSSFAFKPIKWKTDQDGDRVIRTVLDMALVDVSPVTFPAYTGTTSELRTATQESLLAEVEPEPPTEPEPQHRATEDAKYPIPVDVPLDAETSLFNP